MTGTSASGNIRRSGTQAPWSRPRAVSRSTGMVAARMAAMAVAAGCDLCCGQIYKNLLAACQKGLIAETTITQSVVRLFTTRMKLGLFDPPEQNPWGALPASTVGAPKHRALALAAAQKSVVLLKNSGVLPLDRAQVKSIGVCGPLAQDVSVLLGNYNGFAAATTTCGRNSPAAKSRRRPRRSLWPLQPTRTR